MAERSLNGVHLDDGGYMRLEDFCNVADRGAGLVITSGVMLMDEEMLGVECGLRVANYVAEEAVTGWDALLDRKYMEDVDGTP